MNYGPDFTVFFRIWHLVLREKNCSFCVCGVSDYDFADKCVNSVHVIVEMNGFMWCLSGFLCYCAAGLQTVRPGRKGSLIAFYTAETEKCAGMPDFFCSVRGYAMPTACFVAIFACKAYFGVMIRPRCVAAYRIWVSRGFYRI